MAGTGTGRAAIIVLGMHRSGTSALTHLLGYLGAAMPKDGIAAHPDNPTGYWESQALVRVDDKILRTARTSWFDPRPFDLSCIPPRVAADHRTAMMQALDTAFGDARLMAIKDPRLCRLMPLLRDALAGQGVESRAVLMLRSPEAVARSIHARDRSTPAYAQALWLRHMIDAERNTRDMPRVILTYDALMGDWRSSMARLSELIADYGRALGAADEAAIARHLDPALRHHAEQRSADLDPVFARIVGDIHTALLALITQDDDNTRARLDAVVCAYDGNRSLLDDIIHDELRHRRFDALNETAPVPPLPIPEATPMHPPKPDPRSPLVEEVARIRDSGLFDTTWYLERYPDVATQGTDPIEHYLLTGAAEGRDPNPLFRTSYYARQMMRRLSVAEGGSD